MSSTNRSDARLEHISDYYVTPVEDINIFLNAFENIEDGVFKDSKILDCCSGGDSENEMSYPFAIRNKYGVDIDTIDIREDSRAETIGNYLDIDCKGKYDVIITNPPFNVSKEILLKALEDVKEDGYVILLLRLNYFGSKARKKIWETQMPKYCFVHHKRIGFTKDGKRDSVEYMHLVFKKGYSKKYTELMVI